MGIHKSCKPLLFSHLVSSVAWLEISKTLYNDLLWLHTELWVEQEAAQDADYNHQKRYCLELGGSDQQRVGISMKLTASECDVWAGRIGVVDRERCCPQQLTLLWRGGVRH